MHLKININLPNQFNYWRKNSVISLITSEIEKKFNDNLVYFDSTGIDYIESNHRILEFLKKKKEIGSHKFVSYANNNRGFQVFGYPHV